MFGAEKLRQGCVTDRHSGITAEGEFSGSCRARYGLPWLLYSGSETVRSTSYGGGGRAGQGLCCNFNILDSP